MTNYCAIIARSTGEPLLGTAATNTFHYVFAIPKPRWLSHAENMEGNAGELARLIKPLKDHSTLSLRNAPPEEENTIWLFPHGFRFTGLTAQDYPELLRQVSKGEINIPYEVMPKQPTILICTHGKRDACCAKFGTEVLIALRQQAPADINIWEVSHLGGHRFAATMVVQPYNHWYGHITAAEVPALLEAVRNRTILAKHYRGNATFPPPLQVAEKWGWDYLRETQQTGEIYLLNPHVNGGQANVVVALEMNGELQHHRVTLEGEPYTFKANCSDDEIKDRLIWQLIKVESYEPTPEPRRI